MERGQVFFHSHSLMKSNRQSRVYEAIKEQSTLNQTNTGLRAWQSLLCISHNVAWLEMLYTDNFIQTNGVIIFYIATRWTVDLMLLYFNVTAHRRSNENLKNEQTWFFIVWSPNDDAFRKETVINKVSFYNHRCKVTILHFTE